MKTHLKDREFFAGNQNILVRALEMYCERGLKGHGYDAFCGQIKALNYFIRCDVNKFLNLYPDLCPTFTRLIEDIKRDFALRSQNKLYYESWGENYSEDILRIDAYFRNERYVFVYGTLMKDQVNHDAFLKEAQFIGTGTIEGYDIYDLGYYPGIIVGTAKVSGEVYRVNKETEMTLDRLEDEGTLFIKTPVNVRMDDGAICASMAYVYNRSVEGCKKVVGRYGDLVLDDEYVWYVSYGSNLLEERLKYYIEGGFCCYNNKNYQACSDNTLPTESRPIMIPHDMYYSNYNKGSWHMSAVCFLDLSNPGESYGRAYKIRKSQLDEIHGKEGNGPAWYPECIRLDDIDGYPAYTYAGHQIKDKEPFEMVSAEYGIVLYKGLKETYPEMNDSDILDYLRGCGG